MSDEWIDPEEWKSQISLELQMSAQENRLIPLEGIQERASHALDRGRLIGFGTFSQVYEVDEDEVVKFSWDQESLLVLQRLGEKSPFFPKVHVIFSGAQAEDKEGTRYFAAALERLKPRIPKWVFEVVGFYSQPFPADSASQARVRLLGLRQEILTGRIYVNPSVAKGLADAFDLLAEECWTKQLVADLRTDTNFMSREDGHVVISDPAHPQKYMQDD